MGGESGTDTEAGRAHAIRTLADRHGLAFTWRGRLPEATFQLLTKDLPTEAIASGTLPGGITGLVCDFLRKPQQTSGQTAHVTPAQRSTLILTRVPESMALWPIVACHELEDQAWTTRGVIRALMREVEFESIGLNKRYRIAVNREQDESLLRQLFSPALIDALAERAPEDFYFELHRGVLCMATATAPEDPDEVERVCEFGSWLAERIRSEALESAGEARARDRAVAGATTLMENTIRNERLGEVEFETPPADVASAAARYRKTYSGAMRLLPIARGTVRLNAISLGLEAFLRGYAETRGLELARGSVWSVEHMLVAPPGVPGRALTGRLPGGLDGSLLVCNDADAAAEHWEVFPCVATAAIGVESPVRALPALPEDSRLLGTFAIASAGSTVNPEGDPAGEAPPPALAAWLAKQDRPTGFATSATATLVWEQRRPAEELDAAYLDHFCERAAAGVATVAAR